MAARRPPAVVIGVILAVLLVGAVAAGFALCAGGRATTRSRSRGLVLAALALAVAAAAFLLVTVDDIGAAAWWLLGVPVATAAVVVACVWTDRGAVLAATAGALVAAVWTMLLIVQLGLYFAPTALLLVTAAVLELSSAAAARDGPLAG